MRRLGSLVMRAADAHRVPAGAALAVDREHFSQAVTDAIHSHPLITVATFHFVPQRSEPRVSTRIRLAQPQDVLAVAEMNDGTLLMTRTWVEVATNGCA